jgi:hypothetical protein
MWSTVIENVPMKLSSVSNITLLQQMREDNMIRRYKTLLTYIDNQKPVITYGINPPIFTTIVPLIVTPLSLND